MTETPKNPPRKAGAINQIEALQLPKRNEKRRRVYLGEGIYCTFTSRRCKFSVGVVDLTHRGAAVVDTKAGRQNQVNIGDKALLSFRAGSKELYTVTGIIGNTSMVHINGQSYFRVGIKFGQLQLESLADYQAALPPGYVACRGYIRPQAYTQDPFFYNETLLFQVNGFTPTGVDLTVSARCKSLLPGQIHTIQVHLPGRGTFALKVTNSELFFRSKGDNRYRFFVKFNEPAQGFLAAVSEYLTMFAQDMTPAKLRSLKFEIGNLAQAVEVHHNHISDDFRQTHNLQPTVLAPPLDTSTDKSGIEKNKTGKKTHARTFTCKIGPTVVATCKLIFVDKKSERSALIQSGYPLNNQIISASHVELVDLYVGDSATLVDYLLPLMQHVVRVTIQADAQVIVLLASPKVVEVLEKIGFRVLKDDERSTRSRQKGGIWQILALPVKKIVGNASHSLPLKVWDRIYKQLYDYLKKNPKFTKL